MRQPVCRRAASSEWANRSQRRRGDDAILAHAQPGADCNGELFRAGGLLPNPNRYGGLLEVLGRPRPGLSSRFFAWNASGRSQGENQQSGAAEHGCE